jgi:hypothetical protein
MVPPTPPTCPRANGVVSFGQWFPWKVFIGSRWPLIAWLVNNAFQKIYGNDREKGNTCTLAIYTNTFLRAESPPSFVGVPRVLRTHTHFNLTSRWKKRDGKRGAQKKKQEEEERG